MIRWIRGGATESLPIALIGLLLLSESVAFVIVLFGSASNVLVTVVLSGVIATWILFLRQFNRIGIICQGVDFPLFVIQLAIESLIVLPALICIHPEWKGRKLRPQKK